MTVAFIVRENIDITEELRKQLNDAITKLVVHDWATTFLFANIGAFDAACYDVVTKLKKMFPEIKRQYIDQNTCTDKSNWLCALYDKCLYPKEDDLSCEARDRAMVDMCDILVTYCDIDYQLTTKWLNGTSLAIAYAWKRKKRIVNLFEFV